MIELTPVAIDKVKSILAQRKEESGLRIMVNAGGCSGFSYQMTLEQQPQADDEVLEMDGLKVFVDLQSFALLDGAKVDYVEGPDRSGFQFDNPNEASSCDCGECFEA